MLVVLVGAGWVCMYMLVKKEIDMEQGAVLSRSPRPSFASSQPACLSSRSFDLLHVMIDEPDAHLDQQIANHILRCGRGGQLDNVVGAGQRGI